MAHKTIGAGVGGSKHDPAGLFSIGGGRKVFRPRDTKKSRPLFKALALGFGFTSEKSQARG
jgi:hypothetical protein